MFIIYIYNIHILVPLQVCPRPGKTNLRHRAGGDSYRIPPPRHRPEGVSQPAVQITPVSWISISQKWDDEWWSIKNWWLMSMCGLSRVCSGVVGWLAFTSGLGDVLTPKSTWFRVQLIIQVFCNKYNIVQQEEVACFPLLLLGSSLTIAACFRYFEGADEALFCIWRCSNHQAALTCFFFFQGQTLGFVISPDRPKTPLIAKEMRAASVATCLICLGGGGDIGKLTKWQLTV